MRYRNRSVELAEGWARTLALDDAGAAPIAAWCAELAGSRLDRLPSLDYLRASQGEAPELVGAVLGHHECIGLVRLSPAVPLPRVDGSPAGLVPIGCAPIWQRGAAAPLIVVGIGRALRMVAAAPRRPVQRVYAVTDADVLREIWLPASVRAVDLLLVVEDESFGDRPTMEVAAARLCQEGRRARVLAMLA